MRAKRTLFTVKEIKQLLYDMKMYYMDGEFNRRGILIQRKLPDRISDRPRCCKTIK